MTTRIEFKMCHSCACYLANGEGDPDHEEAFKKGMDQWSKHWVILNCPDECEFSGQFDCGVCGQHSYGYYHPAIAEEKS